MSDSSKPVVGDRSNTPRECVDKRHPIQVVAQRSGLTACVIRVWERRYQAIDPQRTACNQRLYSDADIQRLRLLRLATEAGRRISAVAPLSNTELEQLICEDGLIPCESPLPTPPASRLSADGEQLMTECMAAIQELDPRALDNCLARANRSLGTIQMLNNLIAPLMKGIGRSWREGNVRTCQEHMATAYIRSFLGQMLIHSNTDPDGPRILLCTPPNQLHELGALMSAVIAASSGWNVVYLGPNVPTEEIAYAIDRGNVQAVAMSICYPADDHKLPAHLLNLRRHLPEHIPILVGGGAVDNYRDCLQQVNAMVFRDLVQFGGYLDVLRGMR